MPIFFSISGQITIGNGDTVFYFIYKYIYMCTCILSPPAPAPLSLLLLLLLFLSLSLSQMVTGFSTINKIYINLVKEVSYQLLVPQALLQILFFESMRHEDS